MYNSNFDDSKTREVEVSNTTDDTLKNKSSVVAGEEVILDENKKEEIDKDNKTKKLLSRKIVIGIICILAIILCVVIYTAFISNDEDSQENTIKEEMELLVQTGDTYEGLNYSTVKENIAQIGFYYNYSKNEEGNKIDVSYLKVSGFKDSMLEENINEKLRAVAESMYNTENVQDANILYDHIYNYTDVYIFNNVLSTMYCEEKCDVDGNVTYSYRSFNINLQDFGNINLSDVFVKETDVESIITSQTNLKYNENITFSLSPKFIYLIDETGKADKVNLYENKDTVAIYKRYYENKKLFSKTFNAAPYSFTTKKFLETDIYGLEEDNLFVDTCNLTIGNNYGDKVNDAVQALYKEALNKARNISYANPSKRFLVQIVPTVVETASGNYSIIVKLNKYEVDKQFFTDKIVEYVVACENETSDEIKAIDYFTDDVMDAQDYLYNTSTEILTKEVDKDGNEVNNLKNTNSNTGVS